MLEQITLLLPMWVILAVAGGLGQLVRSIQGVYKAVERGEPIKISKIFWTFCFALFTGAGVGFFYPDARAAFLAGYAATDFVEGLVKGVSIGKSQEPGKTQ